MTLDQVKMQVSEMVAQGKKPYEIQGWIDSVRAEEHKNDIVPPQQEIAPAPAPATPSRSIWSDPIGAAGDLYKSMDASMAQRSKNIVNDILQPSEMIAKGDSQGTGRVPLQIGLTGLNVAGEVAGAFNDAVFGTLKMFVPGFIKDALSSSAERVIKSAPAQEVATGVLHAWTQVAKDHPYAAPEIAKAAGSLFNISAMLATPKIMEKGGKAIYDTAKKAEDVASSAVDKVSGWLGGRADAKQAANTWDMVKPNITPSTQADAVKAGQITVKGNKISQVPNARDLEMIDAAKPYVGNTTDPLEATANLKQGLTTEAQKLRAGLEGAGGTWTSSDAVGAINKAEMPLSIKGDATLVKTAEGFKKVVITLAEETPKNSAGALDLRQAVDQLIGENFPASIYTKDTPIGIYVRRIRQSLNGLVEGTLPDGALPDGTLFRQSLKNQTLLYDAIDNAAVKVPKIGTNIGWWATFKAKHPSLVRNLGIGGGAAVGIEGLSAAKDFLNPNNK